LYDGWFRILLQHTFVLLPLAAPLSMDRFDHLLISGDSPPTLEVHPTPPNRPETNEKFVWATLQVHHVGDIYRHKKIEAVKNHLQMGDIKLKVCLRKLDKPQLNDSTCVKCLSTIADLTLAGIDGNKCGFQVNEATWTRFREYLTHDLEQETFGSGRGFLRMQQTLPNPIEQDFYGSRAFFDWFRGFDFQSKEKDVWRYRDLYHSLPYPLAKILNKLYLLAGIRIRDKRPLPRKKSRSPT
ncbi:MAG: hypothetical protein NWF13_08940, partial [Candidatus Bathyarchaeota archaeon]|nr:hypothetical protein [Candidatus Bathyarchaeota archaeon]